MDKKIIIVMAVILFSLIGIIFITSAIISNNSSNQQIIEHEEQEEEEIEIEGSIDLEISNIKNIIENARLTGGYEYLYNDQNFLDGISRLKTLGGVNIVSNINPQNQTYCLSLISNNMRLCIDNNFIGYIDNPSCNRDNTTCALYQIEEAPEEIEVKEEAPEEVVIKEEPEIVIEEPKLTLIEEAAIGSVAIKKYRNEASEEIITINGKEYGPYSESYIIYDESEWGLLLKYNGKWYVNINGKAAGPYLEKPSVEFYGESLGFSYIKDNKYYININNKIYGPYDDLIEFDPDNN